MSDGLANLNNNSILQDISAGSPERLTELIRQIRVPFQIIDIVAVPGKYTCFFRSQHKIRVIKNKVDQNARLKL